MRRHRLWVIFAALCCLPVAVFLLSLDLFREFGSSKAEHVDLMIGAQKIRADRAFSKWVAYPAGAHVEEVRYRALLPDLTSKFDTEPPKAFDAPDPDEIVVAVRRLSRSWGNRPAVKQIGTLSDHSGDPAVPGLFRADYDEDPVKDLFYDRSEDGVVAWFAECDKPEDEAEPVCVAVESRFTDIGVSYTFNRSWLVDWRTIRRNVFTYVQPRLLPKS